MYRGSTGKPGVFSHGFGYLADRHPIPQKGGEHGDDADGSHIDANRLEVSEQQLASEQQQKDLVADRAGDTEESKHTTSPCRLHRSEEHTSELQSLMRSSYAVSCLQKKHPNHNTNRIY